MKIGRRPRRRGKDKKRLAAKKLKGKRMKLGKMPSGKIIRIGFRLTFNPSARRNAQKWR
jgi:hypothetical protein